MSSVVKIVPAVFLLAMLYIPLLLDFIRVCTIDILSSVHCLGTSSIVVWLFVLMLLVDYTETELKYS